MPPPIKVKLVPHDLRWASAADEASSALGRALDGVLLRVHHVGSTAISGIHAKPILDLLPVVTSLEALDERKRALEVQGYGCWGEYGLEGRRYCTLDDPTTGERLVQLHCWAEGARAIERHLAFRDYLRAHPDIARAYDLEKARCRLLHPDDSHAYSACKGSWIRSTEADALAWYRSR